MGFVNARRERASNRLSSVRDTQRRVSGGPAILSLRGLRLLPPGLPGPTGIVFGGSTRLTSHRRFGEAEQRRVSIPTNSLAVLARHLRALVSELCHHPASERDTTIARPAKPSRSDFPGNQLPGLCRRFFGCRSGRLCGRATAGTV